MRKFCVAQSAEYPLNLEVPESGEDGYDYHTYQHQLREDAERLFVRDEHIYLRIIEVGIRASDIRRLDDLENYLRETDGLRATRLFLIPQQSSVGSLVISYEAICKLFSYLGVHPTFVDIIRAFGQRTGTENESYAGVHTRTNHRTQNDISYLVKHAEENGREGAPDPWSLRQMGVYHQRQSTAGDVFVIINPSRPLQRQLKPLSETSATQDSASIHLIVQSSAMNKWRWYIGHNERQYSSMKTRAQLSNVLDSGEKLSQMTDIHFDDTQDIQVLQDRFLQTQYHLSTNRLIMQELITTFDSDAMSASQSNQSNRRTMSSLIKEAEMQSLRVTNLLQRVDATLALVRAILDFRCLASSQSSNKIMAELARLSQKDNEMMMEMTQKAARDTDVLKALTLMGMLYLPAAFVASLMGMGYITIETQKGFSIDFAGEFWVFLVLTLIFLFVTMGGYYLWVRKKPHWADERPHLGCTKPDSNF